MAGVAMNPGAYGNGGLTSIETANPGIINSIAAALGKQGNPGLKEALWNYLGGGSNSSALMQAVQGAIPAEQAWMQGLSGMANPYSMLQGVTPFFSNMANGVLAGKLGSSGTATGTPGSTMTSLLNGGGGNTFDAQTLGAMAGPMMNAWEWAMGPYQSALTGSSNAILQNALGNENQGLQSLASGFLGNMFSNPQLVPTPAPPGQQGSNMVNPSAYSNPGSSVGGTAATTPDYGAMISALKASGWNPSTGTTTPTSTTTGF